MFNPRQLGSTVHHQLGTAKGNRRGAPALKSTGAVDDQQPPSAGRLRRRRKAHKTSGGGDNKMLGVEEEEVVQDARKETETKRIMTVGGGGSDGENDQTNNNLHHLGHHLQRLISKQELRYPASTGAEPIENGGTGYKPLINVQSAISMAPSSEPDELEMTNLEGARLLVGDEERGTVTSSGTASPEFNVDVVDTEETACTIAWQVAIPFLIAGLGMVGAGLVLDMVQHWEVFRVVSEVFILVPALLGLKGNLEMTLASRLSTQANLGHMDSPSATRKMIGGNLALVECQATVVGFLASLAAVIMGWIPDGHFEVQHALLLCASSLVTATVASFVLGVIMVGVVLLSRKCNINPDNVATPIAASLGDLTTLSLLAGVSSGLYSTMNEHPWLAPTIICLTLLLTPVWAIISKKNPYTNKVLYTGWIPVISAMGISSLGGLILDYTVSSFKGIAVFQPVINGVGGNLVAVHASRISTSLHQTSNIGTLPPEYSKICINPCTTFFGKDVHARTSRVLMLLVVPGHLIFTYTIFYVKAGHTSLTPVFVLVYLLAAVIQVALLLYIARILIQWMWTREIDPDNSAIPYLTALGDLLGTALLAMAFCFLYLIGDKDSDVGD